ncbi:MAG: DoxX family membrane protein [Actinomycetota bacterium]|nr:DoxX family membrane protein [Actinomycetota bacterium]
MKVIRTFLRWALGLSFLWPFIDKLFGLGYSTEPANAWIAGGSPTEGFLKFGATGPLAPFYNNIGGSAIVDWLFMLTLLFVGLALILGIGLKLAAIAGSVLMILMWSAVLPKEHNFFLIDEHIIYLLLLLLIGFSFTKKEQWAGLGNWWRNTKLVKKAPFLE